MTTHGRLLLLVGGPLSRLLYTEHIKAWSSGQAFHAAADTVAVMSRRAASRPIEGPIDAVENACLIKAADGAVIAPARRFKSHDSMAPPLEGELEQAQSWAPPSYR